MITQNPSSFDMTVGTATANVKLHDDGSTFVKLAVDCPAGDSLNAAALSLENSGQVKIECHVYPGTHIVVVHSVDGVVYDSAA